MVDYVRYANQGATRNLPLSEDLVSALGFLPDLGVQAEVFSGGQPVQGSGQPRVGSVRHDAGGAADVFFYKDGRRLDWANPEDQPIFSEIVRRGRERGLTGFGAGPDYMQPGSMHIGFGKPAVWGAGGRGANAPDWLRQAYYGAEAPQGDTNMARQPQPVSGTPTMSTRGQAAPQAEEEKVPFFQRPGVGNALDSLAIALQGMTISPNEGLMRLSAGRIADRRETARAGEQRNRTADWLESQGMTAAAQGVRSGAIGARDALAMARGGEATAAQRNYEFLVSQGLPPEQAMERAFGGGVTVNTGDQGPRFGTIPQGYQMAQDPDSGAYRMEPIPGGPAEAELQAAEEAAQARGGQKTRAAGVVLEDIDALQETLRTSSLPITGAIGSLVRNIPGTDAYDASAMIQTIAGNIGFDRLQQMREASPTGGALGAVSERELSTLQSVLGSLDQAQSQAQFERNLSRLEGIYTEIMRKASAYPNANDFGFGGQAGAGQSGGGGFSVTGVID